MASAHSGPTKPNLRSTDGGNTWTNTYTGPAFAGPAAAASGFFATHVQQPRLLAAHGLG